MQTPSFDDAIRRLEQVAPFVVTLLCLVTMLLFLLEPIDPNSANAAQDAGDRWILRMFVALTSAGTVLWGVHCFTGDPFEMRRRQVSFAYFVMTSSFVVFALPLAVKNQAIGTEPVGILSACVLGDSGDNLLSCRVTTPAADCDRQQSVKDALKCERARGKANFQWVLNVGGTLSVPEGGASKACEAGSSQASLCKLGSQDNRAAVTGGMVVPLPFLFIALIGGAISMSRRIPEIQKRSENDYVGTAAEPRLRPCEVREHLAFQILQFVSAPLLAIVAYQVIHPASDSTAAALAFMSGFGSESVLLAIRGLFDGIKPKPATPVVSSGTLSGTVRQAGIGIPGARVVLANGTQSMITASGGSFTFLGVPIGPGDVMATFADAEGKAGFHMSAAGASCTIDLVEPADDSAAPGDGVRHRAPHDAQTS